MLKTPNYIAATPAALKAFPPRDLHHDAAARAPYDPRAPSCPESGRWISSLYR